MLEIQGILEGGSALVDSVNGYNGIATNSPRSIDAAAALLGVAGVAFGLVGRIEAPFIQALAGGVGVQAGVLSAVIGGIQLGKTIDQYRDAMAGYDGAAQQAAYEDLADKTCGVVAAIGGTVAAVPGFQLLGMGIWLGATAAQQITNGNAGRLSTELGKFFNTFGFDGVSHTTNTAFLAAKSWTPPRDPLVLDLDGDGIEAAGIDPTAPVLFDMDGDGIKTATGWIRPDDGIVVLDRNGNGLIDSGRELFGDATVLARGARAGQLAANGFEALADLDLNADGRLDSLDASWGQLRIWRDLNQDGVSQAGELTTLAAQGIASLGAQGTQSNVNLGGGNTQVMSGSFTRTNGMLGTSGVAEVAGSLLLASNGFYREFSDDPQITQQAQSLPQMRGSRLVRNPSVYIGIDAGIASQFFRCSMFTEVMV